VDNLFALSVRSDMAAFGGEIIIDPGLLYVGFAQRTINTREAGGYLGGYWNRAVCTGVHDELKCTALYLNSSADDFSSAAIIISLDLIGTTADYASRVRTTILSALRWDPSCKKQVLVCCTHTHTGPQTNHNFIGMGFASDDYMNFLESSIVDAAKHAKNAATLSRVLHKRVPVSGVAINRRQRVTEDATPPKGGPKRWFETAGKTCLGQNPEGPIVPYADVVIFNSADSTSNVTGVLLAYSMHPTCVGPETKESADYPGAVRKFLESSIKGSPPCMYLNGCCGDVNSVRHRSGYKGAEEVGARLGEKVLGAVKDLLAVDAASSGFAPVRCKVTSCTVPLEKLGSYEDCKAFEQQQGEWLESAKICAEDVAAGPEKEAMTMAPSACCQYAAELVRRAEKQEGASSMDFEIVCVTIGDPENGLCFVGFPGEMFSEYQLKLQNFSPYPRTISIGYANGCHGYFPTASEIPFGGYEVCNAFRVYGAFQNISSAAEGAILNGIRATLESMVGMQAKRFNSHFKDSHDTYNGLGTASNGDIFYVLSSVRHDVGAKMYKIEAGDDTPKFVADLTAVTGAAENAVVQGKSHVPFFEDHESGKLYFGTHVGFYTMADGMETLPVSSGVPDGYRAYPGGYFLSYDPASSQFESLGRLDDGEGILSMARCPKSGRLFGLTWPYGYFVCFTPGSGANGSLISKHDYPERGEGEGVHPRTGNYRCICRSIVVLPDKCAYFSNSKGDILRFNPSVGAVEVFLENGLQLDYFGSYDWTKPGSMSYNWRQVWYHESYRGGAIVGVHGNSGYLFAVFTGTGKRVEIVARLTSLASQRSGMGDLFSYGYLGFKIVGDTVYYLTGAPIYLHDGSRLKGKPATKKGEAKGLEHLHLVTYCLKTSTYRDHGAIFFEDGSFPTYVNSIAVSKDERYVYGMGRVGIAGEGERSDLFRVDLCV
jgi:hypothetical protein